MFSDFLGICLSLYTVFDIVYIAVDSNSTGLGGFDRTFGRFVRRGCISTVRHDALPEVGAAGEAIYEDNRPGLNACLKALCQGDTLTVWKIDRLGRDLQHLVSVARELMERERGHMTTKFDFANVSAAVALLLTAASAGAQNTIITDPEIAAELISGKVQRVWIAEAVKAPLGGTICEEGLRYRFRSDGTAELDSCVDGAWDTTAMSWSVSGGGIDTLNVVLEETAYEATLGEAPG